MPLMIKKFRIYAKIKSILFILILLSISSNIVAGEKPKIFLYSSKFPNSISYKESIFRKNVIDVLLSTQKYDVVFSDIPETISKAKNPQFILKYKWRTSANLNSLFNLEFTLINVDTITISKSIKYLDIPLQKIEYQFRLHLYEFILGRKLSTDEEISFNQASEQKIEKIEKSESIKNQEKISQKSAAKTSKLNNSLSNLTAPKPALNPNLAVPEKVNEKNSNTSKKKITLWDLLKDTDEDSSWNKAKNNKKEIKEEKKEEEKKNVVENVITGPPNPFLKSKDNLMKSDNIIDIRMDYFHFAWRVVKRDQQVNDIIGLTNNFFSVLGLTIEWVIHNPLNIKNLFWRIGFEIDRSVKTEPIKLNDHSLLRLGFGYKIPFNLLPSIYIEGDSLVFANLNEAGEGFKDNIISVFWSTLELAFLTEQTYFSFQYSTLIGSTKVLEGNNFSELTGSRIGFNARYFMQSKIFGIKPWGDIEYRIHHYYSKNNATVNRVLSIDKNEIAIRFGAYF